MSAPNSSIPDDLNKLIVNYLPKSFSEQDILNLFSVFGQVHSCKLMVDLKTGVSKGWGFVNFYNYEDAEKAVSSYNGLKMQNKVIRVAFADGDAGSKAQLFVSGLKKNMTQTELEEIFSNYGKVSWCYLMPKGAGLVRFEKKEEALRAIEELNGKSIDNNPYPLNLSFHQSSSGLAKTQVDGQSAVQDLTPKVLSAVKTKLFQRFSPIQMQPKPKVFPTSAATAVAPMPDSDTSTLYVSGLPAEFDETQMYKMFSPYGAIASAALMTNPDTKKCKGVAFITMMKREDAASIIDALHGTFINDRELRISFKWKKIY